MSKFLIVDDHEVMRKGMNMLIQTHIPHSIIDEAFNGDSALLKIKKEDYDLVILDINMPDTDSSGLLANIFAYKPKSKILMFSMNCEFVYALRYIKMGALGYVGKNESPAVLMQAIHRTLDNKQFLSEALKDMILADLDNTGKSKDIFDKLSEREFEITQHLVLGKTISQIAATFNLHSSTVGSHKAKIFEKLNCKNILELNTLAKAHNLIAS